jgi:hypothetical protein
MMYILTIFRWSHVPLCCLIMTISLPGIADEVVWMPRFGTVTTLQTTDIKLTSQDIQLTELEQVYLSDTPVWAFHGKAEFTLFNTARIKKKPTILVSICTSNERFQSGISCEMKKTDLKIKVDGREISWTHFARENHLFARFSLKFRPRGSRKVEMSHRLFERNAGTSGAPPSRDYMIFDYHLEDAGSWDGPVGATYFSAKLPFKADVFNAKVFTNGEKFLYKNRLAYFIGRKLKLDNDDGLSFYVTTPSYKHRVDRFMRKAKAIPHSAKRKLALASVLSAYPGAEGSMKKHVDLALKKKLKQWSKPEVENAVVLYSTYLIELNKFKNTRVPCDETICIEKNKLEKIISNICSSNRCTESGHKALAACCASPNSEASRDYNADESIEEMEDDTDEDAHAINQPTTLKATGPSISDFMLRYAFLLLMAALGFIGATSWIIYRVKTRNRKPRYNKTLF